MILLGPREPASDSTAPPPSSVAGLLGGRLYRLEQRPLARVIGWSVGAVLMLLLGLGLTGFSGYGGPVPLNRNMMSLSFVLVGSAAAMGLLALTFTICEWKGLWGGEPLTFLGRNSLVVFAGHLVLKVGPALESSRLGKGI
jgi:hypothetical protein